MKDNRGITGGLVTSMIAGVGAIILTTIIILVIVSTLNNANLLTANSAEANATLDMSANFTSGIDNISEKLPTVLLITAVVLLFAVILFLVAYYKKMNLGGGGGGL